MDGVGLGWVAVSCVILLVETCHVLGRALRVANSYIGVFWMIVSIFKQLSWWLRVGKATICCM